MVKPKSFEEETDKTSVIASDTFKGRIERAGKSPACVVCLVGPTGYVGRQWELTDPEFVIGRSVKSPIFLDDASVSKSHARLVVTPTDVAIIDLDSTNKTIINNQILQPLKPYRLQHNDQVKMGNVILKYLAPGSIEAVTNQETYGLSQIDALTQAFNKGALLIKGPELFKRAEVMSETLSAIVFDIDHFKKTNDTFGHLAGDYVLKELAHIIREKLVRSTDYLARFGGEEFVLILFGSPLKKAIEVAERIRTTIEFHTFVFEEKRIPVTISLGVAQKNKETRNWEELLKRADNALYMSKESGRNRVSAS